MNTGTSNTKKSTGFTDKEKAAVRARALELKAEARASKDREEGEKAVLAAIAAMKEPDRSMAKRLHAIIKASAPTLMPKTWYGFPAYAKDGKIVCFFQYRRSSTRGTQSSASTMRRTSTKAPCGRPVTR
jgi:hypothetical protein